MAQLKVKLGSRKGELFELGPGISTLGREQTSTIQISEFEVSRKHAEIQNHFGECVLVDLASANGTSVNDRQVVKQKLKTGDFIRIGKTVFEFHESEFLLEAVSHGDTVANGEDDSRNETGSSHDVLQQTKSNLDLLYNSALAAGSYQSSQLVLQRILDLVFYWISAERVCILIQEDEQEHLYAKSIDPDSSEGYSEVPFDIEYAIIKYVFRQKEGVVVQDILGDERFPYVIEADRLRNRQVICVPIKSRCGIRGVIYADKEFANPETSGLETEGQFDEEQMKILIAIGLHAAVAIENSDHYQMMLHSERVTAVGNALASLSHHIKNILQSIHGGNHLIEEGLRGQDFGLVENGWQIVKRNQETLSNLVMDMLSYSRTVVPRLSETDLKTEINKAVQQVQTKAESLNIDILVDLDSSGELPVMYFEPELIRRAIHNVILFGINSCRENSGGQIKVQLKHLHDDEMTIVEIIDNGVSMSNKQLNALFDLMVINVQRSRLGLGLAVAKKMINEMKGEIIATQNDGQGSTFKITFGSTHLQPVNATPKGADRDD